MYALMNATEPLVMIPSGGLQLPRPRILLVDDDRLYTRRAEAALLGLADLRVATGRRAALTATLSWAPDIAILDMFLPDGDALRLPDELQQRAATDEIGLIYLAKGPGAATRFQSLAGRFLGVVHRDAGSSGLLEAIRLASASRSFPGVISL
jgi:PleD family two-component response regulator